MRGHSLTLSQVAPRYRELAKLESDTKGLLCFDHLHSRYVSAQLHEVGSPFTHARPFVGVFQKSIYKRTCQLLAINAEKMAPRTTRWLQERQGDAPTKGLGWTARPSNAFHTTDTMCSTTVNYWAVLTFSEIKQEVHSQVCPAGEIDFREDLDIVGW